MLPGELQRDLRALSKRCRDVDAVPRPHHGEAGHHRTAVASDDFGGGSRRRQTAIAFRARGDEPSFLVPAAKDWMMGGGIAAVVPHPGAKKTGAHEDSLERIHRVHGVHWRLNACECITKFDAEARCRIPA